MGSGAGLGTNPSNPLIKETVAPLTEEGPQLLLGVPVPVPVLFPGRQHLKLAGPGQRPETVFPLAHVLAERQLPPSPHVGLVQHFTWPGSLGQNPVWDVPPEEEQDAVVMHTPGVPFAVQGPLRAARARIAVKRMA